MVAGTRAELCHGSHIITHQRRCHTVRAPMGCRLGLCCRLTAGGLLPNERPDLTLAGLGLAGSAHQLLLSQALDVQLGALADLACLYARLLLPPRIHLRACRSAETLIFTRICPMRLSGNTAIV